MYNINILFLFNALLLYIRYEEYPNNKYKIGHTTPNNHFGGFIGDLTDGILFLFINKVEINPKINGISIIIIILKFIIKIINIKII
jgi:hypothetical protein